MLTETTHHDEQQAQPHGDQDAARITWTEPAVQRARDPEAMARVAALRAAWLAAHPEHQAT